MATLYKLTEEYTELLDALDGAETNEEIAGIWEQIYGKEEDIVEKADAYARILRNKQAEAEMYKAEAERLTKRRKAAENCVERLKAWLLDNMQRMEITDIETGIGKWHVQLNPASCEVLDVDMVPAEYHIPQPDKIDSRGILQQYRKTGEIPSGVDIRQAVGIRFK